MIEKSTDGATTQWTCAPSLLGPNVTSRDKPSSNLRPIDEEAEALLQAWIGARTGYPWIDAAMTQLKEEGEQTAEGKMSGRFDI